MKHPGVRRTGGCGYGAGYPGAAIGGDFVLAAGQMLQIAVGQKGGDRGAAISGGTPGGGGGGGRFVIGQDGTALVIAGSGGGSFNGGPTNADLFYLASAHLGDGEVLIDLLSTIDAAPAGVQEPASLALPSVGLVGIGAARRRRSD